ncbi:MAG TPA: M56 family metallopeptidase [Terriglobia bacterium]|nr:M56 family metallopeptidase [Terriglobia bacterium]
MSALLAGINHVATSGLAALLNTLWYAGAVVGLTWLGLRCLPRVNAATRYWIWTAVLGFLIVLPFLPGIVGRARSSLAAREKTMAAVAPLATVPVPPVSIRELAPVTLTVNTAAGSNSWPLWLLAAWIVAACWQLERLARGLTSVRRLKARAKAARSEAKRGSAEFHFPETLRPFRRKEKSRGVKEQLRATSLRCVQHGVYLDGCSSVTRRLVQVLTSGEIASPVAVGYMRPAVIIPPGLLERLEEGERQNVLLHELAHLARYDDWMALVTHALGALLVLHPLAAIVMGRIEREREMACDDFVVARTGSARSYARSLARLHDLRWNTGVRLLAAGLLGRNSSLGVRIESLLRRGREFSARPSLASLGVTTLLLAVLLGAGGLMPGWIAIAQTKATLPTSFEVASIRPGKPGEHNSDISTRRGGRFSTTNTTLKKLIEFAYGITPEQIEGVPAWAKSRTYTIRAVAPPGAPDARGKQGLEWIQGMVQSLLADRFKLRTHRATKQLPVYEIVVAKHGPKLKPMAEQDFVAAHRPYAPSNTSISTHDGNMTALGISLATLADELSRELNRTVIDRTGLTGRYDFTLTWDPASERLAAMDDVSRSGAPAAADSSAPSIFTAIQQQLGLKLKPAKGPVEVLVIDHVEPPTPN